MYMSTHIHTTKAYTNRLVFDTGVINLRCVAAITYVYLEDT